MPGWHEEDHEEWPVRYSFRTPPQEVSERFREKATPRWERTEHVQTSEVQQRLLWLLLAVEIGMALTAAFVLPLVFLSWPAGEGGIVGAVLNQVGEWLDLSSRASCLVLALPMVPFMLGFNGWLWCTRRKSEEARDCRVTK